MSTAQDFRQIAMSIDGTMEAPHFERTAFKVVRIYARLAPDGLTAILKLSHDEQELKCITAPEAFRPVSKALGRQGWTTTTLAALNPAEPTAALEMAWRHGFPRKRARPSSRTKR